MSLYLLLGRYIIITTNEIDQVYTQNESLYVSTISKVIKNRNACVKNVPISHIDL